MKQLLLVLFLLPLSLIAQDVEWARFINGAGDEFFDAVATDIDGNVYGVGSFDGTLSLGGELNFALGASDGFLFKASPQGEMLWHIVLGGSGISQVTDIQFDGNGNLLVSGYFTEQLLYGNDPLLTASEFEWHAFMLWATPEGELVRSAQIPCSGLLQSSRFFQAKDGGYYLAGNFRGTLEYGGVTLENDPAGYPGLFILKLSPELNVVWHKHLRTDAVAQTTDIKEGPDEGLFFSAHYDGRLILEGLTLDAGADVSTDGVVFKFDKFGQLLWHQVVSGQGLTRFSALSVSPFGEVYLTGVFAQSIVLGDFNASPDDPFNLFIGKIGNNGTPLWMHTYSNEAYNSGVCIRASPAGGFWLSGLYGGDFSLGGIQLNDAGEPSEGFLAKFSDDGAAQWAQTINGPDSDYMGRFAVHPDGALYSIGTFRSSTQIGSFQGNAQDERDIALIKVDCPVNKPVVAQDGNTLFTTENYAAYQWYKDGSPIPGNSATALAQGAGQYQVAVESFTGCVTISDVVDVAVAAKELAGDAEIQLFPNPAQGEIFIANWPKGKKATGRLLSLQGQVLHRWASGPIASGGPLGLPVLAPGIYVVELASEQGRQFCRLLIP